ncbi:hypothetical protein DFS34DRAFT_595203 [Phlyctochytrium arcticum]|nr:hypothetical protein DFS34DRAFT_595203 [Phlyctochytrium arcticum]
MSHNRSDWDSMDCESVDSESVAESNSTACDSSSDEFECELIEAIEAMFQDNELLINFAQFFLRECLQAEIQRPHSGACMLNLLQAFNQYTCMHFPLTQVFAALVQGSTACLHPDTILALKLLRISVTLVQ